MKPENQKETPRLHKKKRVSNLLFLPILVIIVIGIFFFLTSNQQKNSTSPQEVGKKQHGLWETISRTFSEHPDPGKYPNNQQNTQGNSPGLSEQQTPPVYETEHSASPTTGPAQQAATPYSAADTVNAFFSHLDTQPYLQSFHLYKPSNVYFTELIQNLLDNPPVISRETDDLFTVLKNTAHFYRVIGKDNIIILKSILDQEKPFIEDALANFYVLAESPDSIQKNFSLRLSPDSLYNYAGFFLNTMGGRLYLFRRDSVSRMTVSYYGILVIDKANRESNNRNGIQIKEAIDALIADIENSGDQLRLKERYLDKLYELKEKYQ